jgi:hypothetical protein
MNRAEVERHLQTYSRVSCGNKIKFEKLRAVLNQMQKEGIDCILLKGADLIPRLYGVLGARALGDADLLVHESDLPAIDHLLTHLGYRPLIDGNPAYVDPDNILPLDIITKVWYMDDQSVIWQRAVRRDFEGIPIKGMGANDLLVYLTAYNVVHRGFLSASFAHDIALLVEKEDMDWDFVVEEASRNRLKIPMYHGLSFVVTRYAGVPIREHVLRGLAPSTLGERLLYWFFQKLVTDQPVADLGHLLLFLTQPGLKKWRWLRDAFFPSPAFLKYRYGDRWITQPLLTRLLRPFSLLFQAVRLFTRIVRLQITERSDLWVREGRVSRGPLPR